MTIDPPAISWVAIAPELVTGGGAVAALLFALAGDRVSRALAPLLAVAALLAAGVLTLTLGDVAHVAAWEGQIDSDPLASATRLLAIGGGLVAALTWWIGGPTNDRRDAERTSLLLGAVCGMGLLASAGSLVTVFIGIELLSICLYVLCALEPERATSLESGFKYLVIGGVGSALLLYGTALVYVATGSFELAAIGEAADRGPLLVAGAALIVVAFLLKTGTAPLHWWVPDVYDGAPTPVTAFMATATKAVAFLALMRIALTALLPEAGIWEPVVGAAACATILLGNLGAVNQRSLKRLLAWSSVAQAGYLLIGVYAWRTNGIAALVLALGIYVLMTGAAFLLLMGFERRIGHAVTLDDLRGRGWVSSARVGWIAALPGIALTICALSLAGLPPLPGFVAKLGLFDAAIRGDAAWLAVVGAIGSAVSMVYYIKIPFALYVQSPTAGAAPEAEDHSRPAAGELGLLACGSLLVLAGLVIAIAPGKAISWSCDARGLLAFEQRASGGCAGQIASNGSDRPSEIVQPATGQ